MKKENKEVALENEDQAIITNNIIPYNEFRFLKLMANRTNDECWK